jgi:predicted DNA-binding transcriptional regulator AlpA
MADLDLSQTHGPVMTQAALAKHFGVSTMAIWRWRHSLRDFPPAIEIAGRLYWSIAAVEAWKAARAARAKPQRPMGPGARAKPRVRLVPARGASEVA